MQVIGRCLDGRAVTIMHDGRFSDEVLGR